MIVLLDTNVLLDALAEREPFYEDAAKLWMRVENGELQALVSTLSLTTVYYVARRHKGKDLATRAVHLIAEVFGLGAVDRAVIEAAMASKLADFEDAVQAFSAVRSGASHIVTRDLTGFSGGPLPVLTPQQCLAALAVRSTEPT